MRCIPSSVFHEVRTTRLAIKSFSRKMEMMEEIFRGRFTYQWHNRRCWEISSSYICQLRLFHSPRKFCNVCRRSENIGQAVFEAHESALCPSTTAQCQSKGRRIHRTIFKKAEKSFLRLRMHRLDRPSTWRLSNKRRPKIRAQVWRHSGKTIGTGRLQGGHR